MYQVLLNYNYYNYKFFDLEELGLFTSFFVERETDNQNYSVFKL